MCLGRRDFAVGLLVLPFIASSPPATGQDAPVIAAASDLQFALTEAAKAFQSETGLAVRLAFGSSGNFARQIRQGAPFQMFLSADEQYVFDLARDGFTADQGAPYALGRIALFVPRHSPLKADGSLADLAAATKDGRLTRFAIANPEHAPYGKRAEEALRSRGLWDAVRPKLVFGENVSQAAQFAASSSTQGGIIAYSLALSPQLADAGRFELIPAGWHAPLRQRMVLLKTGGPTAKRFYDFMRTQPARDILKRYGFALPDE